jgi:multimeric flavodoxin WrbA
MQVLSIQGSPRLGGNTATVLGWVEDELRQRGHEVTHIDITDLEVRPCGEDLSCMQHMDKPGCAISDDANALFEEMIASDLVILASPLFCWSFSGQLKVLLDRGVCLYKPGNQGSSRSLIAGTGLALVATAAGPLEGNMDLIAEIFDRYAEYMECENRGHLLVPRCTKPAEIGPEVRAEARAFAQSLAEA